MTSRVPVYAAFVMGQGGYLFSLGMPVLASRARAQGVVAETFRYGDFIAIAARCAAYRKQGYRIALIGYSLGCSTATYLQSPAMNAKVDLLMALAESELAQNYPINKRNTARSVLWHGWDFLSSAGEDDGFDTVLETRAFHLLVDFAPAITASVLGELTTLQQQANAAA